MDFLGKNKTQYIQQTLVPTVSDIETLQTMVGRINKKNWNLEPKTVLSLDETMWSASYSNTKKVNSLIFFFMTSADEKKSRKNGS